MLLGSAVLSAALVAGVGGAATAAGDGPGGGHDGITHLDGGGGRGAGDGQGRDSS